MEVRGTLAGEPARSCVLVSESPVGESDHEMNHDIKLKTVEEKLKEA
jgi:hypothetical protein